ncbi:hypothetical protein J1605_007139 [Eschrichtius robustus]|uniref:Uncharacterized protein n=1 Tax=Eschrichtius robustus TaxID=9764 RepID=A0AB34H2W2_ESCRO|nr:hypothetical protein J1605_007139 [Eschrichtius robustus]
MRQGNRSGSRSSTLRDPRGPLGPSGGVEGALYRLVAAGCGEEAQTQEGGGKEGRKPRRRPASSGTVDPGDRRPSYGRFGETVMNCPGHHWHPNCLLSSQPSPGPSGTS